MKKILHVILGFHPALTAPTIRFYDRYFSHDTHAFCLYSEDGSKPSYYPDDCTIPHRAIVVDRRSFRSSLRFIKFLRAYDLVVLHSMVVNWRTQLLILLFYPRLLDKMLWIGWGADLYDWNHADYATFRHRIRLSIYRRFCASVKHFVAVFPPDADYHRLLFGGKAKIFTAPYRGVSLVKQPDRGWVPRAKRHGEPLNILIGHRCTQSVGHIQCLEAIKRFRNESIRVVIPVGSGESPEYVDLVRRVAKDSLGDKVSFIDHYMSREELNKLAAGVDVAFFNAERQIALGTIHCLFVSGVKIFLPSASVMGRFFKSQNIPVQAIESMPEMSFESFSEPVNMKTAYDYVRRQRDDDFAVASWTAIYQAILSGGN